MINKNLLTRLSNLEIISKILSITFKKDSKIKSYIMSKLVLNFSSIFSKNLKPINSFEKNCVKAGEQIPAFKNLKNSSDTEIGYCYYKISLF